MEGLTLFVAVAASALVFVLSPVYGLIVYVASFAWYPSYLTIPVGTIDFTVRRIVILAVLTKLFLQTDLPSRFKFIWLDKLIIIYFVAQICAGATTAQSMEAFLENRAGAVFDMVLPYFAVRLIIRNRQQYLALLKGILVVAAPMAIVGFYQSLTGNNPVGFLKEYAVWGFRPYAPTSRLGFFRAETTFAHPIMAGLFFAMFGSVCAGILHSMKTHKMLCWIGLGLMGVGVFSSMSSGPMLAALLAGMFIVFYRWRKYWKPVAVLIILMCGVVEFISNRHFYDVLSDFAINPATSWYRSKLIDVALYEGGMSDHWLTGYGVGVDPGWGPMIDGRSFTDTVNHYILVLQSFGLVGLVPFLVMNLFVVKELINAYKASIFDPDRWLVWCLLAGFFGLWAAFMSVSLFAQPTSIYYMMIAFTGAMPAILGGRRVVAGTALVSGSMRWTKPVLG